LSRSSNQKRKRKARRATGVPCDSGAREARRNAWGDRDLIFHPVGVDPSAILGRYVSATTYLLTGVH
jgi:hypothetical protein